MDDNINRNCFAGGKDLIPSSVPITGAVLSQEIVQGASSGQTQEIIHLKKTIDFVLTKGYTSDSCLSVSFNSKN